MSEKINVNAATIETLTTLPGIGRQLAERTIAYRREIGPFRTVAELAAVTGISERMIHRFRDKVTAGEPMTKRSNEPFEMRVNMSPPDPAAALFLGHRLTAMFTRRELIQDADGSAETFWIPDQITEVIAAEGEVLLYLPDKSDLKDDVRLRVVAPDGEMLHEAALPAADLPSEITLPVTPKAYATVAPNTDPAFGQPTRLRGKVINLDDGEPVSSRQVVIWGTRADEPQEEDFTALVVVDTDAKGYFSGPYPLGPFTSAHGTVAVGAGVSVPIHLREDDTFPESIILVVDVAADLLEADDCDSFQKRAAVPRNPDNTDLVQAEGTFSTDLGVGHCVDFTQPDRTLEEFTFSYVVRTTEPEIKGLTLEEPEKIDVQRLAHLLSSGPSQPALAPESGEVVPKAMVSPSGPNLATEQLDAKLLKTLARGPKDLTASKVAQVAEMTAHTDLIRLINKLLQSGPVRTRLSCKNPVDWDQDPTIYQSCTIAHGHVLRFKQEWVADGYSMGNLLYSLPLAPGQKKQIAVVDWERRESATRAESLTAQEQLSAFLGRDRDINEIVSATVSEKVRGGSRSNTDAFGIGAGLGHQGQGSFNVGVLGAGVGMGGMLGIGGGNSEASSSAWQKSSRKTAGSALQQLRDRTVQSASALRSQRSSVVQTVRQGERVTAQTETVANYNHCHAITIQYFEVLRHLLVRQRLVDVQECLFIPLAMSHFTVDKTLRWRNTLRSFVRNTRLRRGLDALERIDNHYEGSDLPQGQYAEEQLDHLDGHMTLRFQLVRPPGDEADYEALATHWQTLGNWLGFDPKEFYQQYLEGQAFKDKIFREQLGPRIARKFVEYLEITAVKGDGTQVELPVDLTLMTEFVHDHPLHISVRLEGSLPPLQRKEIKYINIHNPIADLFGQAKSRIIVEAVTLRYRTQYASDHLVRDRRVVNDLMIGDDVRIDTPLNRREQRNPREEDKELARQTLDHLNEHIERYHHILWWHMSPDRRYMLLDGFEAPNSNGRSVASVVDNELIGIAGNCLIMPVARGFHLDPTFRQDEENRIDLFEHYQPTTPIEPMRVAIPTKGVYAEAAMGACNACEVMEEDRFWRWEQSPIPDSPTPILPVSTETRRTAPPDLTAKDFPSPLINMQNAPAAPDPTGLSAALQLLGQSDLFPDITGLEGNQRNALAALENALQTARFFGSKAADLAMQERMSGDYDKVLRAVQKAIGAGLMTEEEGSEFLKTAIGKMAGGGGGESKPGLTEQPEVSKLVTDPGVEKVHMERSGDGQAEMVDISRSPGSIVGGLFGAGGKPGTIGKKSSKADALARIAQCRASTKTSPWKLDRTKMLDRLEQLVNNPDLVDQDGLNLCGPAAFLRLWVHRDPLAVVEFACELYDTGKSRINNYVVEPDDDSLIAKDYSVLKAAHADFTPEAEWMIMGALRDAENFFFDFEGEPEEDASAGTGPGELAEWLQATNLYATVEDDGNFFLTKEVWHATNLKPGPSRDVILLINAHMLTQMDVTSGTMKSDDFILNAFPNHFVVLTSKPSVWLEDDGDEVVQLSCWTWGRQLSGKVLRSTFEANYYGAVIAEGASP